MSRFDCHCANSSARSIGILTFQSSDSKCCATCPKLHLNHSLRTAKPGDLSSSVGAIEFGTSDSLTFCLAFSKRAQKVSNRAVSAAILSSSREISASSSALYFRKSSIRLAALSIAFCLLTMFLSVWATRVAGSIFSVRISWPLSMAARSEITSGWSSL